MINKECILDSSGRIYKDFINRSIPQYSNNSVSVNFLIPTVVFSELDNYTVQVAARITANSVTTQLPTLYAYSSKTLRIDNIDYIKFSCILSSQYTDKIGTLELAPQIYEVQDIANGQGQTSTRITLKDSYVFTQLNVIKSVTSTDDNSLDQPTMAVTLANQIDSKHIMEIEIENQIGTDAADAYEVISNYSTAFYNGWVLVEPNKKEIYIPYKVSDAEYLYKLDYVNGAMYQLSNIEATTVDDTTSYSCDVLKLNYGKDELDSLLSSKLTSVDYADGTLTKSYYDHTNEETITESVVNAQTLANDTGLTAHLADTSNPHSVTATQVGLGNVSNYTISNAYNSDSATSYASSKAVYDGLATKADLSSFTILNNKVNDMLALIGDPINGDPDNIVNTLTDIITIFNDYNESNGSVLSLLNQKVSQSDFNELSTTVSTLSGNLTALTIRVGNIEADNTGGLIILTPTDYTALLTLTPSEFVANTGLNANDYPYKTTLTSDAFINAKDITIEFYEDPDIDFQDVFEVNNTTGTLTLYADDLPTNNVVISKIKIIKSLSAINAEIYANTTQIAANTSDITNIYTQLNNKQNISNIVKSTDNSGAGWNTTTSDSKYPSEKLTKDTLDKKLDKSYTFADTGTGSITWTSAGGADSFYVTVEGDGNNEYTNSSSSTLVVSELSAGFLANKSMTLNNATTNLSSVFYVYPEYMDIDTSTVRISQKCQSIERKVKDGNNDTHDCDIPYINNGSTIYNSLQETYSREKIDLLVNTGIYDLTTDTMTIGTDLTTSKTNLSNLGDYRPKVNDIVIDANNTIGKITGFNTTTNNVTITPVREIGKKRYTHNILIQHLSGNTGPWVNMTFNVETDSATPLANSSSATQGFLLLYNWLNQNGYGQATATTVPNLENAKFVHASGYIKSGTTSYQVCGIAVYNYRMQVYGCYTSSGTSGSTLVCAAIELPNADALGEWHITDSNPR